MTTGSGEYSKRSGLVRGATNCYMDKGTASHTGGGAEDATITLNKGTTRWVRKVEIAAPSFTGSESVAIYKDSVAAANLLADGYLLPSGVFEFRNPISGTGNLICRVTSTTASTVYINVDYDYA